MNGEPHTLNKLLNTWEVFELELEHLVFCNWWERMKSFVLAFDLPVGGGVITVERTLNLSKP
jgi:hypothetical protein